MNVIWDALCFVMLFQMTESARRQKFSVYKNKNIIGADSMLLGKSFVFSASQCASLCSAKTKCSYSIYRRGKNECLLYPPHDALFGSVDELIVKCCYKVCDAGWQLNGGHCYWFSTRRDTWIGARQSCYRMGGKLAELTDPYIDKFVTDVGIRRGIRYWIGLSDLRQEGVFLWEASRKLVTYANWIIGDPNNYNNEEHCVLINFFAYWADMPCHWMEYYVCQQSSYLKPQ